MVSYTFLLTNNVFGAPFSFKFMLGYCGRYSESKNKNYNAGLFWEVFRVQRQQKLQCKNIVGDIQCATTTKTTMQGYCGRYSGCNDNRNHNVGLLWEIFRVQRQQKLQCRRYLGCTDNRNYNAGDIQGATTTETTM